MRIATLLSVVVIFCVSNAANAQLTFNFNAAGGTPQQVINGFTQAGANWSSVLKDPVTVNIDINFTSLGASLGETMPTFGLEPYSVFRNALQDDATSAADLSSVGHLQGGSSYSVWINRTSENPNGAGKCNAVPGQ